MRPKRRSRSTTRAAERSLVWSRRMDVIQASKPARARRRGATLRISQHLSGVALPQRVAVERGLRRQAQLGAHRADRQPVTLFEPAPQRVGLGEEQAGVEGEHVDGR